MQLSCACFCSIHTSSPINIKSILQVGQSLATLKIAGAPAHRAPCPGRHYLVKSMSSNKPVEGYDCCKTTGRPYQPFLNSTRRFLSTFDLPRAQLILFADFLLPGTVRRACPHQQPARVRRALTLYERHACTCDIQTSGSALSASPVSWNVPCPYKSTTSTVSASRSLLTRHNCHVIANNR